MEFLDAVQTAIDFEKNLTDFYSKSIQEIDDDSGKSILRKLANEESAHYQYLIEKKKEWLEKGEVNIYDLSKVKKASLKMKKELKIMKEELKNRTNDYRVEILLKAYENEKRSYQFYLEMTEKFSDPNKQQLFKEFLEMEKSHIMIVQAEIDSINQNGFWYDSFEINLEE